jgi:hypothetical protein
MHQDASRHAWLAGAPPLATNEIYSALLVEEKGTASTFRALMEAFGRHGLPLRLYTDRGSHYFHTAEAGGKSGSRSTDAGRPCAVASGGRAHSDVFAPGPWPLGASVPDLVGSRAEGAGAGGRHDDG